MHLGVLHDNREAGVRWEANEGSGSGGPRNQAFMDGHRECRYVARGGDIRGIAIRFDDLATRFRFEYAEGGRGFADTLCTSRIAVFRALHPSVTGPRSSTIPWSRLQPATRGGSQSRATRLKAPLRHLEAQAASIGPRDRDFTSGRLGSQMSAVIARSSTVSRIRAGGVEGPIPACIT